MPIFQDPDQRFFNVLVPSEPSSRQPIKAKSSEESIPTEFCDGPLPDAPPWETVEKEDDAPEEKEQSCSRGGVCTSDRNELMERIKRGESPTWIPSQTVCAVWSRLCWRLKAINICHCLHMSSLTIFATYPRMRAISDTRRLSLIIYLTSRPKTMRY